MLQHPPPPWAPRWPYRVFVPFLALAYTVFRPGFMLEASGSRGVSKPWWFDVAIVFAIPGLFLPPYIGSPLWGSVLL